MPIAAAGASIIGGIISGGSAGKAADTQTAAANNAAQLEANSAKQALDFQKQVYGQSQQELNPYLQAGYGGLANLQSLLGITPQGNAVDASAGSNAAAAQSAAGPRYGQGADYKGGLFNSWGGSDWKYAGQKGQNDVYTRANGSPAYDFYGPGGWQRGGAGAYAGGFDAGTAGSGARSNMQRASGSVDATSGGVPLSSLVNPQLGGFGSLMQPYGEKFTAPTAATEQNDPGYQFRLKEGEKALQNSAAAKGTLLSGATAKDINAYGQDYANQSGNILLDSSARQGQNLMNAGAARASGYGKNAFTGALGGIGGLASLLGNSYNQGGDVGDWSSLWGGG